MVRTDAEVAFFQVDGVRQTPDLLRSELATRGLGDGEVHAQSLGRRLVTPVGRREDSGAVRFTHSARADDLLVIGAALAAAYDPLT